MQIQIIEAKQILGWALRVTKDGRSHDNLCGSQAEADGLLAYLRSRGVEPDIRRVDLIRSIVKTEDDQFAHLKPVIF